MDEHANRGYRSLEVCAGAGGLTLGLERAGFSPLALLDTKVDACRTLLLNRPHWCVLNEDFTEFLPQDRPDLFHPDTKIHLLAAGLPRLRSAATVLRKESGHESFLLQAAVWLAQAILPRAFVIENIPDLAESSTYATTRQWVEESLNEVGYSVDWTVLDAQKFGVPQVRRQAFMVAMAPDDLRHFAWPAPLTSTALTVAETLYPSMTQRGWPGACRWASKADGPAPTIVGGSDNRGGADLGPSGSKNKWARMGVNGGSIGDDTPGRDDPADLTPKLTVSQVALLQGFPSDWTLSGRKTSAYRQIGNSSPPPVGEAVGRQIVEVLSRERQHP
ncbi:DNA cytosine methyltransferase [Streptomyces sp. NPDC055099]